MERLWTQEDPWFLQRLAELASSPAVWWQGCYLDSRGGGPPLSVFGTTGLTMPWMLARFLLLRLLTSSLKTAHTKPWMMLHHPNLFTRSKSQETTCPLIATNQRGLCLLLLSSFSPSSIKIWLPVHPFKLIDIGRRRRINNFNGTSSTVYSVTGME